MALEIKLGQKLSQSLVMTPQLQQAIKLLQLGRLEYLETLEKELLENPLLEDANEGEDEGREAKSKISESSSEDKNVDFGDNKEWKELYPETVEYSPPVSGKHRISEGEDGRPSIENTAQQSEGLTTHLLWQLRTSNLQEEDENIAVQIIGNIDRNGYLSCDLQELATLCGSSPQEVEKVLKTVQTLDPPGIAARSLQECLLIQLEQCGLQNTLVWRIVSRHLGKLEIRNYDLIAKDENVAVEEVYAAVKYLQNSLEPRPGRPFIDELPIYITPDIYVQKIGNDYVVSLNESGVPQLRLNEKYKELAGNGMNAPDKQYLQERMKSASWFIRSIQQRQQTIYRVTKSIMKYQHEFLEKGVSALKPLVLREIAADIGMHESTISRVTTNKFVHTPQGVFELKYFFSSGLKSGYGEVSSESVKDQIRTIIASEDPLKPLSDQAIVEALKAEGIDVARRTVAKYREAMNILSSSRRKKIF